MSCPKLAKYFRQHSRVNFIEYQNLVLFQVIQPLLKCPLMHFLNWDPALKTCFFSIEEVRVPFSLLFLAPLCCRGTAASLRNWWQFSSPLPLRRPPSQHTVHQRARPKIWNLQPLWDVFISIAPQTTTSPEHSPPEDKTIELTWWPIQRWEN